MRHFCREISQLVSDGYERRLSPGERLRMRLHLWMCRPCSSYSANLSRLDRVFAGIRKRADERAPCLTERDRQKILGELGRQTQADS